MPHTVKLVSEVWEQCLAEAGDPPTPADGRPRPIWPPCKQCLLRPDGRRQLRLYLGGHPMPDPGVQEVWEV